MTYEGILEHRDPFRRHLPQLGSGYYGIGKLDVGLLGAALRICLDVDVRVPGWRHVEPWQRDVRL